MDRADMDATEGLLPDEASLDISGGTAEVDPEQPAEATADAVEEDDKKKSSDVRTLLEWLGVVVVAVIVALLIKTFFLQAFQIPSGSMEPTVEVGDRILVNKLSYRFGDVGRGDLVVFERVPGSDGPTDDLIKRAVALPGEIIEVGENGRISITGTDGVLRLLDEPYLEEGDVAFTNAERNQIWHPACTTPEDQPNRCGLDDESYYMLGDNRHRSADSRSFGPVNEDLIVGRAFLKIWPLGSFGQL